MTPFADEREHAVVQLLKLFLLMDKLYLIKGFGFVKRIENAQ